MVDRRYMTLDVQEKLCLLVFFIYKTSISWVVSCMCMEWKLKPCCDIPFPDHVFAFNLCFLKYSHWANCVVIVSIIMIVVGNKIWNLLTFNSMMWWRGWFFVSICYAWPMGDMFLNEINNLEGTLDNSSKPSLPPSWV